MDSLPGIKFAAVVGLVEFAPDRPQVKRIIYLPPDYLFILLSYGKLSTSNLYDLVVCADAVLLIRTTFSSKKPFCSSRDPLGVLCDVPFSFMLLRNEYGFGWIVYGI